MSLFRTAQLRLKEAREDAEELQDEGVHGVHDVEHKLKKVIQPYPALHHLSTRHAQLLRHFHQVVSSPSLGEDEECPICAESLELNTCSRLVLYHSVHTSHW